MDIRQLKIDAIKNIHKKCTMTKDELLIVIQENIDKGHITEEDVKEVLEDLQN